MQSITACDWPVGSEVLALSNGYRLRRIEVSEGGISRRLWNESQVEIRPRSGGERLKLPGREGRRSLKHLYQQAGTPPWERNSRPLIYLDGRLAAVAGLWVDEWACSDQQDAGYRLDWEYADNIVQPRAKEDDHVYGA